MMTTSIFANTVIFTFSTGASFGHVAKWIGWICYIIVMACDLNDLAHSLNTTGSLCVDHEVSFLSNNLFSVTCTTLLPSASSLQ